MSKAKRKAAPKRSKVSKGPKASKPGAIAFAFARGAKVTIKASALPGTVDGLYLGEHGPRYEVSYVDRAGNAQSRWYKAEELAAA